MVARLSQSFYGEEQQMSSRVGATHKTQTQAAIVTCPDCGEKIVLTGLIQIGLGVRCENCEAELQVVNLAPVEVDAISQEPEDEHEFLTRW
jgi:lysine biosynthesis protein LysW